MISEKELIKNCKAGIKASQYELVQRYSGVLLSLCRRYSKDNEMAKDILQESWMKVFDILKTIVILVLLKVG